MPDTVITNALRGILNEEDDNVDAQDLKDWLGRIETALSHQGTRQQEQGERIAKVEEKATAAHRRMDESLRALKGPGRPAWVMIVLAMIGAASAIAVSYVSARASQKTETKIDELHKADKK